MVWGCWGMSLPLEPGKSINPLETPGLGRYVGTKMHPWEISLGVMSTGGSQASKQT